MKMVQVKAYRKDLKVLLDGEREQIVSAKPDADPKQFLLADSEVHVLMTNMGHSPKGCPAYHRKELGYPGPATRYRDYMALRRKRNKTNGKKK
jgi:hypothetical protein